MTTHSFCRADRIQSDCHSLSNAWIPWGQWLALIAMTAEHFARFVLPEAWGLAPWATLLGRIALPLFAGMVAWHFVYNTRNPLRYARRLLMIGLIAQLPYMLALDLPRLNICFTLAAGLWLAVLIESPHQRRQNRLLAVLVVLLALRFAPYLEYGLPGLLLVPAFVIAFKASPTWQVIAAIPVLLVASVINTFWLFSLVTILTTVVLVVINLSHLRQIVSITTMPRAIWLSWYPLHLGLIAMISLALELARPSL